MLWPLDIELLTTLKNASTDAVTSALSTPVLSAISFMMSALVTCCNLNRDFFSGGQIYLALPELKMNIEKIDNQGDGSTIFLG
jgi:hypothetical protein